MFSLDAVGGEVEFVLEGRSDLQPKFIVVALYFVAQQRARAGSPWTAIGFADVAMDEIQGRRTGIGTVADRHATAQVGDQPQVTVGPPRIAGGDDVLRGQRAVGRDPTATSGLVVLQFIGRKRPATGHAD